MSPSGCPSTHKIMPRHYVVVRGGGGAEVIDATAFAKKKSHIPLFFDISCFCRKDKDSPPVTW